jgi:flavin reductase (DIM6/NTAB) family NADH-FMN oxidoreductase RutF
MSALAQGSAVRASELRAALGHFATGVTVVTAQDADGVRHGTTANAVSSVSLDPPLVLVCLRNASQTGAAALATGRFAINILRDGQHAVAERFARRATHDAWDAGNSRPGPRTGAPLLDGALATLECVVHDVADGGDHRIVIGRVLGLEHPADHVDPLLFYRGRYHALRPDEIDAAAAPEVALPSGFGDLRLVGVEHDASVVALVGAPEGSAQALAYVHLGCVFGDALGSLTCRRRVALHAALDVIRADGAGLIVYHRDAGSLFAGCCVGTERPAPSGAALAAVRRSVQGLDVRRVRLLVDPRERVVAAPAELGLDVAATVELAVPAAA